MQLIGYSAPQVDVSAVPGLGGLLSWTESTLRQTARRAVALASLIDRVGSTFDDVAELRRAAEIIAGNLSELGASAAGIDRNAGKIAEEISGLSTAAQASLVSQGFEGAGRRGTSCRLIGLGSVFIPLRKAQTPRCSGRGRRQRRGGREGFRAES
jgi:hypothetical protein